MFWRKGKGLRSTMQARAPMKMEMYELVRDAFRLVRREYRRVHGIWVDSTSPQAMATLVGDDNQVVPPPAEDEEWVAVALPLSAWLAVVRAIQIVLERKFLAGLGQYEARRGLVHLADAIARTGFR